MLLMFAWNRRVRAIPPVCSIALSYRELLKHLDCEVDTKSTFKLAVWQVLIVFTARAIKIRSAEAMKPCILTRITSYISFHTSNNDKIVLQRIASSKGEIFVKMSIVSIQRHYPICPAKQYRVLPVIRPYQ